MSKGETVRQGPSQRPGGFVEALLDNIEEMVFTFDTAGTITYLNTRLRAFLGVNGESYPRSEWEQLRRLYHPDGRELTATESPMRRTIRGEEVHGVELIVCVDGEARAVVVNGVQYLDDQGDLAGMLVIHDLTDQRRAEADRDFNATHDALTGLPNRSLFVGNVIAALRRGTTCNTRTAILHLHIDRFRIIRAAVGYDAAQQALLEIVTRIESVLRRSRGDDGCTSGDRPALLQPMQLDDPTSSSTTSMARIGSDEFLIVCEHLADEDAVSAEVARMSEALSRPVVVDGAEFAVTASVGITLTAELAADPNRLIAQAESALHRARDLGGGGHAFFAPSTSDDHERRAGDIEALGGAIARGELRLLYQPQVSLPDERMVGVEALLRWDHPDRGTVSPLDFIPLAEQTGLIIPIGRWVLEEACRQGRRWRLNHPDGVALSVAVNVSARQLETDLALTVSEALRRSGFEPECLCIEVTESSVMRDVDSAIATLEAVKALGVRISVDDFGTGYSSLAYLKRLPADELKVDKSFVDGLGSDPDDTAIVAAVVASAHALGLSVVAEGVETAQNVSSLVTLGCEQAQGFHYSHPVSPETIDDILISGRKLGASAAVTVEAGPAAERVLIVDDAADVRQLAHMSLAAFGFEVHEASDGQTALAIVHELQPDCVILDLNLPDITGFDICRALRHDPVTRDCTIVMLTSEARGGDKVEAFSLGVDEYIVKPFSPRDLATRVRSAMRQRAELQQLGAGGHSA
jgi:PAS domain S-box-containing protein